MQVQAFPGVVEHRNKFNDMFNEPATNVVIAGFYYESDSEPNEQIEFDDE